MLSVAVTQSNLTLSSSDDGEIIFWDLAGQEALSLLKGHEEAGERQSHPLVC